MNLRVEEHIPSLRDAPGIASQDDDAEIASAQTFSRLRALVAKGYAPDFAKSDDSCLLLTHPRKRFRYRHLLLDSSGTVQWLHDDDYTMHFSRWEKKRFDTFLRHVPRPDWWDQTREYRERIFAFVIGAALCAVMYFAVLEIISLVRRFVG
jgi:hypothetical protein